MTNRIHLRVGRAWPVIGLASLGAILAASIAMLAPLAGEAEAFNDHSACAAGDTVSTRITKAPNKPSTNRTPTVRFEGFWCGETPPNANPFDYFCLLDGETLAPDCSTHVVKLARLRPGRHTFRVYSAVVVGNYVYEDHSPASYR